ncbi:MAG: hypothetical protein ABL949_10170 [Fimbriimonadaceae bacterium]
MNKERNSVIFRVGRFAMMVGLVAQPLVAQAVFIRVVPLPGMDATAVAGGLTRFVFTGTAKAAPSRGFAGLVDTSLNVGGAGMTFSSSILPGAASHIVSNTWHSPNLLASLTTPATGSVRLILAVSNGGYPASGEFRSAAGPVFALSDGIASTESGEAKVLCEVRPASGARRAFVISVPFDQFEPFDLGTATVREFALADSSPIMDRTPTPDGGFVFLTGTETAASSYYISPDGTLHGPFFVGSAQQVAYSPLNGGTILTAGRTPSGNMFFTRGPMTAPFSDSLAGAFPFVSTDFTFKGTSLGTHGEVWWCGGYRTFLGDLNGFILSTQDNPSLTIGGADVVGSTLLDDPVNGIAIGAQGIGVIAADGKIQVREMSTRQIMATYPPVADPAMHYSAVGVNSLCDAPATAADFSHFGVIGVDTRTQENSITVFRLLGELQEARTATPTYVGGLSPKLLATLFEADGQSHGPAFALRSSSPSVIVPDSILFPRGLRLGIARLQTRPVAVAEDVEITVESSTRPVVARFRLLPPAPYVFTPASLTLRGGSSGVLRLSLNGKAPAGGLQVALSSDGPEATPPTTVIVPEGLYSRSFVIRTTRVAATANCTITATYAGVSATAPVAVTP